MAASELRAALGQTAPAVVAVAHRLRAMAPPAAQVAMVHLSPLCMELAEAAAAVVQPTLLGQQVALAELVACLVAAALVAVAALRLGMLATAQQAELL